jgi:hypothetical protein
MSNQSTRRDLLPEARGDPALPQRLRIALKSSAVKTIGTKCPDGKPEE